ncbi:MAG: alpha-amylase family glycosyl hydrolase, partial [Anaerolineae bacterium]
ACESAGSLYRNWYYIPDIGTPGNQPADRCDADDGDDTAGPWTLTYDAWYGYGSLPKLQANTAAVRSLIWSNGTNSVGPYWVSQGADGWRFDVGGDVDPGLTNDPANDYWEGFRAAVRAVDPQALTLGEEWGDASAWLLGNEWDSVMNYRFRSTLLSWLFTGCSGNGCTGGTKFQENDSNDASSSGPIQAISPSQFNARLRSIAEDYPPMAFQAMMNLEGSHDTNRLRFLLKKVNNDDDGAAVQRMKEWWLFSFTYPGAPTLYYGDEIGLNHDGVWDDSTWQDDPYNRVPFPWPDASGNTYSYDPTAAGAGLQAFARHMASLYWSYPALQDGAVQHGLIIDDANKLYGYARTNDSQTALIVLNRDSSAHTATFSGLNAAPYNLPDGTELVDGLAGDLSTVYTVAGGSVSVLAPSNWGVVLLERAKIDVPAAAPSLSGSQVGSTVTLSWPTVTGDLGGGRELVTAYEVHRSTTASFTPDDTTLHATVSPSDPPFRFGSSDGDFTWSETVAEAAARPAQPNADYYYRICTRNAAGVANRSGCPSIAPLAVTLASFQAQPESGHVLVTWETVSEVANTGFNLYRSPSPKDPGDLLAFLPSQAPGSTAGASYSYQDWTATTGQSYWYWLEDVDTSGTTTLHGPVSVVYQARTIPGALGRIPGQSRALGRCHAIRREAVR